MGMHRNTSRSGILTPGASPPNTLDAFTREYSHLDRDWAGFQSGDIDR